MIKSKKVRIVSSTAIFILLIYLTVTFSKFAHIIIPYTVIPLVILNRDDFETKFMLFSLLFIVIIIIPKLQGTSSYGHITYFAEFAALLIFNMIVSYTENRNKKETERINLLNQQNRKKIKEIDERIEFYRKYRENLENKISIQKTISHIIKDIQTSSTGEEIRDKLVNHLQNLFPDSNIDFVINPHQNRIIEDIYLSKTSIYIPNAITETRYPAFLFSPNEKSLMIIPLITFSKISAVIKIYSDRENRFKLDDFRTAELVITTAALAVENLHLFSTIGEMARKDPLTNLFTHKTFQEKLEEEILVSARTKQPLTLVLFDIDHFKKINDTYGHQAGDEVLKKISNILVSNVREFDFVARYGGEEFVIILPQTDKEKGISISENIRNKIKMLEFKSNSQSFKITVSIGIAEFPREATSKSQLIRICDERLYRAKKQGRDRIIYE